MEVDEPQLVSRMIIETEDDDDDDNSIQAEDLAAEPLISGDRSEPWHSQFSSNWIPMITRDVIRQQRQVSRICGIRCLGCGLIQRNSGKTGKYL